MDRDRAGAGRPLTTHATDGLLGAVHRRLRLNALAGASRSAAWLTVVVALVAVLLHAFVRPVSVLHVALAVTITWGVALLRALVTPITARECAAWADRQLGGGCAYETLLEARGSPGSSQAAPARQRLAEWIEEAAPLGFARLAATPREARVLRPAAVALVAALLATVLLLMPAQDRSMVAGTSTDASTPGPRAQATAQDEAREQLAEFDSPDSTSDRLSAAGTDDEGRRNGGVQPAAIDAAPEDAHELAAAGDVPADASAARATPGGRDAGAGIDDAPDAALSQAWQGELATTLRALATPPPASSRADRSLAADYEGVTAADTVARSDATFTPAAAAPQARRKPSLVPGERAYVRAYFAAPGATP